MSTLLLVDNLPIVRDGLRAVLERAGHQVLGEVDNGLDALEQCRLLHPQVVILELLVPQLGGLDLLRRLRASHQGIKLLVYSVQEASLYAARSLQAGADAYVCKSEALSQLHSALQALSHGRSYFPREVARQDLDGAGEDDLTQLSGRELTVLQMLSQGLSNKDIAEQLSLSYKTISTYKARLHQKLKVGNDFQLLEVARSHGLVAGDEASRAQAPSSDPQLLREHGLLRALLDAAPYPMFVRDLAGRLLMCNRRYLAYAGESFEAIHGSTIDQALWLPAPLRERSRQRFTEAVARQEPFLAEAVIEHLGEVVAMHIWCTPFRDQSGQLVAMLGGMRDLTERDRLLSTLRHEGAEARYESHLKSSTLAAVSQELGQMLAVFRTAVQRLLGPSDEPLRPALQSLAEHVQAMYQCLAKVDALMDQADHPGQAQRAAHDLGNLTEAILAPVRQQLQARGCELDLGPGLRALQSAWIDARHYRQLLEGLCGYLQLRPLPAHLSLRLATRIQPRGLLRLSLELTPWYPALEQAPSEVSAYATLQRLLLRLQGRAQTLAPDDGDTLVLRVEMDLPQVLADSGR